MFIEELPKSFWRDGGLLDLSVADAWGFLVERLTIQKTDAGYQVQIAGGQDGPAAFNLEGDGAERLLAEMKKLNVPQWSKHFEPIDCLVLDGYMWSLTVNQDGELASGSGSNAVPIELFEFLDYLADLGLPRLQAMESMDDCGSAAQYSGRRPFILRRSIPARF